uniref:histidine kinase n=1 Tax=uncultured sulfate-reducing bacterium TaxID=153939 RepID=Q3IBN8_9BACT|nr:Two-component regulator sensor and histidine kinase [uncultured sulfate-reducing bacterium]
MPDRPRWSPSSGSARPPRARMNGPGECHRERTAMNEELSHPPRNGGESSYEHYFDSLPSFVSVMDRDFTVVESNGMLRETFGDPTGRPCYDVFRGRTEKCPDCPVEETFRTGKPQRSESLVICGGEDMPVMCYTSPMRDESGEVVRVLKLDADISDVKKLQGKLFRTQQRLQHFFDEVPCYVSVQDCNLKLVAANRRFKEDFGDEVGEHCFRVYKHRSERCLECPVAMTFEDGQSHQSEEVVTSMSGEQYNVLVHTSPIRNETGEITHVVEMSTNITPLRRLQSQLESTGLLISSISHSIKGLLTGLDGGMYLVNAGLKKDNQARVEKGWEMVTRNVDLIRSTVLNILYYAKEREPDWTNVAAVDLTNEVHSIVGSRARDLAVVFNLNVDESAGELEGDRMALRSLLVNLLENSLDACRVDSKKSDHQVTLSARGDEDEVHFEVSDNGIGMERETREKVFTLFFSSKGMEGTGLGLFIANNIAKGHGGGIVVESEPGQGTRFRVRIPRKRAVEEF